MTDEINTIIEENKDASISQLALKLAKHQVKDKNFIIQQIQGYQIAKNKIPFLASKANVLYPDKRAMEQCSSEITAKYKSEITNFKTFIDLNGGFGIDTLFLAKNSNRGTYIESNEELFNIARHNLSIFETDKLAFIHSTAESFLKKNNSTVDLVYLDPDRRMEGKLKGVRIADCSPNLIDIKSNIFEISNKILVKYSPLLDIKLAIDQLKDVKRVDIISVNNDCKEVLFLLEKNYNSTIEIHTVNFTKDQAQFFTFNFENELAAQSNFSTPLKFLYEPNSSILKAGAFKSIAQTFNVLKIATNSHLYTSENEIIHFPGRTFEIIEIVYQTKHLPKKANIISRNHPLTAPQIKAKAKVKDGGEDYIIASSDINKKPFYCIAKRLR